MYVAIIALGTTLLGLPFHLYCHAADKAYFPHPWREITKIDGKQITEYINLIDPIIDLQDKDLAALIPARRPVAGEFSELGEGYKGEILWSPEKPDYLMINGNQFIPEVRFPPVGIEKVKGPDGRTWDYEYVVSKRGKKIYITSIRDAAARDWLRDAAFKLAQLYSATGQKVFAHKAAVIITAFADVMPSYAIYGKSFSKGDYTFYHQEPYPQNTGRWGSWYPVDLRNIEPLVLAFDQILASGVVEDLSNQYSRDIRSVVESFLINYCKLIQRYDLWHAQTLTKRTNNVQPYKCRSLIAIGRTVERPEFIHYAYSIIEEIIHRRFGLDGVFPESPAYHNQVLGNLQTALSYLRGYCDPPGLLLPTGNHPLKNLEPDAEFPILKKAERFSVESVFPDGSLLSVHDTYSKTYPHLKRNITTSRIWPSFGHAVLGRGVGDNQMEVHLDFGFDFSHRHNDTLNLILWAYGEELLSDIGYTYTYRGWATSSLAHNLIVVDGMVQKAGILDIEAPQKAIGGRIKTWAPLKNSFGVIEAEDINSYQQCGTYQRTIMVVENDKAHAFVVDVFEVAGGNQHDYMAHGSADKNQTLTFGKPAEPFADSLAAGGKIHLPAATKSLYGADYEGQDFDRNGIVSQYWGNIRNVQKITGSGPWVGIFAGEKNSDARLRMHLLAPTDCALYAGEAPSIRRANEDSRKVETFMMPIFTARRSGENLNSRYVVVWEPFRNNPWLNTVSVEHNSDDGLIIGAKSSTGHFYIFWTPSGKATLFYRDMQFDGRFGVICKSDRTVKMAGVDTKLIKIGNAVLSGRVGQTVTVTGAGEDDQGDFLKVSNLPAHDDTRELWGILLFPGKHTRALQLGQFKKDNVIRCPQGHGLEYNSEKSTWYEQHSPGRTFQGKVRLKYVSRSSNAPFIHSVIESE